MTFRLIVSPYSCHLLDVYGIVLLQVPQFRPQSALHFLNKFVHGNTVDKNNEQGAVDYLLSPLLPPNATLVQMSDDEFDTYMDAWTESAMFVPYVLPVNN